MSADDKKQEIIPELQEAIERLLGTDCLSEELKVIAIQKAKEILDRHSLKQRISEVN